MKLKDLKVKEEHEEYIHKISLCQEANCEVKKEIFENIG